MHTLCAQAHTHTHTHTQTHLAINNLRPTYTYTRMYTNTHTNTLHTLSSIHIHTHTHTHTHTHILTRPYRHTFTHLHGSLQRQPPRRGWHSLAHASLDPADTHRHTIRTPSAQHTHVSALQDSGCMALHTHIYTHNNNKRPDASHYLRV
jgi:hypothetical protein